jgi:hydrogenase expression/formation protein HypE
MPENSTMALADLKIPEGPICPAPLPVGNRVLLGHGSGGRLSADLLRNVFLPLFSNPTLDRLEDQAIVEIGGQRLAFTTDSFVVQPLFFPGGDIGSLAVHGTINDLAMGGARPLFLSAAFILEEGLDMEVVSRVAASMARAAADAGVAIVTGDTKVVERGKGDGIFINTTGIGLVREGARISASGARPGDCVIVSGTIGDHGIAVMAQRDGLEFETTITSDSAPLHTLVDTIFEASSPDAIHSLRDPTRGGVASSLNEIAAQSGIEIRLEEAAIPVRDEVRGACELLGLDPMFVANEGKLVAIVAPEAADAVLQAMRSHPLGGSASIAGTVRSGKPGLVTIRTPFGSTRIVAMLAGDQLPRIC